MSKEFFMDEVTQLKKEVQEAGRLREYNPEELEVLVNELIDKRIIWAKSNNTDIYRFYQNMSFKDKGVLRYTVTESVGGLGILGKIITDTDITEVMINGYNRIFVEKSGKLMMKPYEWQITSITNTLRH